MKYILAVSGGVDSVVLLDMMAKMKEHQLIVAHFDHGIRDESAADARFVEALAKKYQVPFEMKRVELGTNASEDAARKARYTFLFELAKTYNAKIVTAHHQDDVIETIAINLMRGTGWRGLAVLNSDKVIRPLLTKRKQELRTYALRNNLEWVEDETNATDTYLRNRIRSKTYQLNDDLRARLFYLRTSQKQLTTEIDKATKERVTQSRYFMTMIDVAAAHELLRTMLLQQGLSLTRPQRDRLLYAIKTAKPGTIFEAGQGVRVRFTDREFIVNSPL